LTISHLHQSLLKLAGTLSWTNGCTAEARRPLSEAATLEPNADFIQERIKALP
jgi:hypothetical protein